MLNVSLRRDLEELSLYSNHQELGWVFMKSGNSNTSYCRGVQIEAWADYFQREFILHPTQVSSKR